MAVDFFGAGALYAIPTFTATGSTIAVPTPVQFGIVQGVTIDDSAEIKELYGADQYPVDIGRGKSKLSIKCKQAQFSAELFNTVYFGTTLASGYNAGYQDRVGATVPTGAGATSIFVQATSPTGGTSTFITDLGVQDGNGVPYIRVASGPTGGQYSVTGATGGTGLTYVFGNQSAGNLVFISYSYANSTNPSTGKLLTISNTPMGQVPQFEAQFFASRRGRTVWRRFPACVATKLTMDWKNDDFVIPDFEISAFADSNNVVQYLSESE